jgi:NADH:ubiquinone oxidoreductase subunit K
MKVETVKYTDARDKVKYYVKIAGKEKAIVLAISKVQFKRLQSMEIDDAVAYAEINIFK